MAGRRAKSGSTLALWFAVLCVAAGGCGSSGGAAATDPGGSGDTSTETASSDAPTAETSAEALADVVSGGAWTDPTTGLTWQTGSYATNVNALQAKAYCDDLVLADASDWRLPSISEIRTLLRGCPDTVAGGACHETDECPGVGADCYDGEACMGCEWMKGPGQDGCYWPPEMEGLCDWYWSSTPSDNPAGYTCFVHFGQAHLSHDVDQNAGQHQALCVYGP